MENQVRIKISERTSGGSFQLRNAFRMFDTDGGSLSRKDVE